jgi:hypothetical protein
MTLNENEAIALERIALSARKLLNVVEQNPNLLGVGLRRELANLGQDIGFLDMVRKVEPVPTAKDVIAKVIDDNWAIGSGSVDKLAGDIHEALMEAGYL